MKTIQTTVSLSESIIRHLLVRPLFLAVCILAQGVQPQFPTKMESRVGEWGAVSRIEFEGLKSFPTNEVINALIMSPAFLLASHPAAPQSEYAPALSKQITLGYQDAGFPDVKVVANFDESQRRVRVTVNEGNLFVCGGWVALRSAP